MSEVIVSGDKLARYYDIKQGAFKPPHQLKALDGASFSVSEGETLAVVGESGCGKSTLARLLTLIEEPTKGDLFICGEKVDHRDKAQIQRLRRKVQIIFQDPYGSLNPRKRISTILAEPLVINTDKTKGERDRLVDEMLEKVGLRTEQRHRYPHMFSGGQRQRIAIARALILRPKLIIADEPVSALDVSIQAQILNLMMDLQEEMKLALVFISHGLSVVRHIGDELMVMYLGRPVEQGDTKTIFDQPLHPYTNALLSSTPFVDPSRRRERVTLSGELPSPINPPSGCAFHERCEWADKECSENRPESHLVNQRQLACFHPLQK